MSESGTVELIKSKTKSKKEAAQDVDLILDTATEIENIAQEQVESTIRHLKENVDLSWFKIGGILTVVNDNAWYTDAGYDTLKDYAEKVFDIKYRKARYWIEIYTHLVNKGISWELVKSLGWTKLRYLAPILTKENVEEWVKKAMNMTTIQILEVVKGLTASASGTEGGTSETMSSSVSTITFKVHEDQKEIIKAALEKCREETGTQFDAVALENICTGYMNGSEAQIKVELSKELLTKCLFAHKADLQVLGEALDTVFPDYTITFAKL